MNLITEFTMILKSKFEEFSVLILCGIVRSYFPFRVANPIKKKKQSTIIWARIQPVNVVAETRDVE